MIEIAIPAFRSLALEHLVLDFNGTLACDGVLPPGVGERIRALAARIQVHVVTAYTIGQARNALRWTPCRLTVVGVDRQAQAMGRNLRRFRPPEQCAQPKSFVARLLNGRRNQGAI